MNANLSGSHATPNPNMKTSVERFHNSLHPQKPNTMNTPTIKFTIADNSGSRRNDRKLILSKRHVHVIKPGDTVEVFFEDEYSRNKIHPRDHYFYSVQKIEFVDAFTPLHYVHLLKLDKESK